MGFLTGLLKTVVNVAAAPIAIVADVVKVANGDEPDTTTSVLGNTSTELTNSIEDLVEGDLV